MKLVYVLLIILSFLLGGILTYKIFSLTTIFNTTTTMHSDIPRGFTISIEELKEDSATDPSTVKIERGEYKIPQKVLGNKFTLSEENFENPKIKNSASYLQTLGFNPDQYISIEESPGYTQIAHMITFGTLHRVVIYEGSPTQVTVFLSDPFALEK